MKSPPLCLKKKALLIGIQSIRRDAVEITQENVERVEDRESPKSAELKGPHRDVIQIKRLLVGALYHSLLLKGVYFHRCLDVYHYDPKDITVLIDDDNPDHIQPTKENMVLYIYLRSRSCTKTCVQIRKIFELVDGALAGDRFFFHCL